MFLAGVPLSTVTLLPLSLSPFEGREAVRDLVLKSAHGLSDPRGGPGHSCGGAFSPAAPAPTVGPARILLPYPEPPCGSWGACLLRATVRSVSSTLSLTLQSGPLGAPPGLSWALGMPVRLLWTRLCCPVCQMSGLVLCSWLPCPLQKCVRSVTAVCGRLGSLRAAAGRNPTLPARTLGWTSVLPPVSSSRPSAGGLLLLGHSLSPPFPLGHPVSTGCLLCVPWESVS